MSMQSCDDCSTPNMHLCNHLIINLVICVLFSSSLWWQCCQNVILTITNDGPNHKNLTVKNNFSFSAQANKHQLLLQLQA